MAFSLTQITGDTQDSGAYQFGEVLSVSGDLLSVRTTTGLEVTVNSNSESYNVGDQLVLGIYRNNPNNLFIIKRLDTTYPSAINYSIDLDQD